MFAHERNITVTETGTITISGLPVQPGQRVRVTVSVESEDRQNLAAKFRSLFKEVQELSPMKRLSDSEIAREVSLYRKSLGAGWGGREAPGDAM